LTGAGRGASPPGGLPTGGNCNTGVKDKSSFRDILDRTLTKRADSQQELFPGGRIDDPAREQG